MALFNSLNKSLNNSLNKSFNKELAKTVSIVAFGIFCWGVAAIVALVIGAAAKIIAICVVGALLGLIGIRYAIRRAARGQL